VEVSRRAARAAGKVNNPTARSDPEVAPAQGAPRAKVAQAARPVDMAMMLAWVDGPAAQAGNPQVVAESQVPEVLPAREALSEAVEAAALAAHQALAAFQAQVASPEREARVVPAARAPMAARLAEVAPPEQAQPEPAAQPVEAAARRQRAAQPEPAALAAQVVRPRSRPRRLWVGIPGIPSHAAPATH